VAVGGATAQAIRGAASDWRSKRPVNYGLDPMNQGFQGDQTIPQRNRLISSDSVKLILILSTGHDLQANRNTLILNVVFLHLESLALLNLSEAWS
jgi:hypothetical protein